MSTTVGLTRREMLGAAAAGAGAWVLTAYGVRVPAIGAADVYTEVFPTSPLVLRPFTDPLPVPRALAPVPKWQVDGWSSPPGPRNQDSVKGAAAWTHQLWPGTAPVGAYPRPLVYRVELRVGAHSFTSSPVQPIGPDGRDVVPPDRPAGPQYLPASTIYCFNGTFPGPMINAEYGRPALVRFENHLDENPMRLDRQDFGAPNYAFLTHLHNGHTAPESDGNPHHGHRRFVGTGRRDHHAAYEPGEWIDNLYLNYPAGGLNSEKQSFLWFHDHVHGHTGANVYKGLVGLYPIYDRLNQKDMGTEWTGYRLPGVRRNRADGGFDVDYDIPLVLYDCRLDDGVTSHHDFHNGTGETHPRWWGMTYFRHFPNHGFVGDLFTVNGVAYPVLEVQRRRYRLRFLDASVARVYDLMLMRSGTSPVPARSLGYVGDDLQGQYRLPRAEQCMRFVQVAADGGLLPRPIVRDTFELWPAKRREVVVDFTRYLDGSPTRKGDEIYLVNTMKMIDGREWEEVPDPAYVVPLMKIVIGDSAPDASVLPTPTTPLRPAPPVPFTNLQAELASAPTFVLDRDGTTGDPETEWFINGRQFDATDPMISVKRGSYAVWRFVNGGGGWVHPMHIHQEEHRTVLRDGRRAPDARHPDDTGKEDTVALDPGEEVVITRRFRTFVGPYVAHCHNLAHEDHNMMFGWEIVP